MGQKLELDCYCFYLLANVSVGVRLESQMKVPLIFSANGSAQAEGENRRRVV
jgi:hypothetical protein